MSREHIELEWLQISPRVWATHSLAFPGMMWHTMQAQGEPAWGIYYQGRRCLKDDGRPVNLSGLHEAKLWAQDYDKRQLVGVAEGGIALPPVTADPANSRRKDTTDEV